MKSNDASSAADMDSYKPGSFSFGRGTGRDRGAGRGRIANVYRCYCSNTSLQ